MRLIDADKLLGEMNDRYNEKAPIVPNTLAEGFMQMEALIKEQLTAYDIDKVVEELEIERFRSNYEQEQFVYDKAIEIVKVGVR